MTDELAKCILAFEEGLGECHRPEDRLLVERYLSEFATLLASAVQGKDVSERITRLERRFGLSWIVDIAPFRNAFDLWERVKVVHGAGKR